jgi:hypothetical protein
LRSTSLRLFSYRCYFFVFIVIFDLTTLTDSVKSPGGAAL